MRRLVAVVAGTAGLLAGGLMVAGAQPAQAAATAPSWLVGYQTVSEATGTYRACTAIQLTSARVLTSPDCFTGRSGDDIAWGYNGGELAFGYSNPVFRLHPQYDWQTRKAAFAVADNPSQSGSGAPVLASTADAGLYAPGAKATFFSWAGPNGDRTVRHQHTEQVAILSVGTCTSLLGHAPAAGTFCTLPAPGTATPAPADQCLGDAGGALVAGGKLIGISATSATRCVAANGVRVYTNVTAYRGSMIGWGRDVDSYPYQPGSVLAKQDLMSSVGLLSACTIGADGVGLSGCDPDYGDAAYNPAKYKYFTQSGDLDGDGYGEVLARTPGGALYRFPAKNGFGGNLDTAPKTWLSNGWAGYNALFSVRDFSGDGFPDLIARDSSGTLWLHRGNGKGGYTARVRLATGFGSYNLMAGRGDLSGDGLADFVARDKAGTLWLFKGNGKGGFAARTSLGTGFSGYREIVASGDMDYDGRQDLLGRTPGGGVFLINALTKGGGLAAPRLYARSYWKPFTQITS